MKYQMQDTLNVLCEKLSTKSKVYFCRFGDGDLEVMLGRRQKNHAYSAELQKELIESISIIDEDYLRGGILEEPEFDGFRLTNLHNLHNHYEHFLRNLLPNYENGKYYSSVLTTYMALVPEHQPIFVEFLNNFIRPKKKLFIGSVDKEIISTLIGNVDYYVNVPCPEAYYKIDEWWPKVLECVDDVDLVIPSAGLAGRVAQKRLWNLGKDIHSIELGCIADAIAGLNTRSWMSRTTENVNKLKVLL